MRFGKMSRDFSAKSMFFYLAHFLVIIFKKVGITERKHIQILKKLKRI